MRVKKLVVSVVAIVAVLAVGAGGAYGLGLLGDDAGTTAASAGPANEPSDSRTESPTSSPTLEGASSADASPSPTTSPSPSPTTKPTVTPTPDALMAKGDSGDDVRELQARLKQIQWYEPDITGEYSDVTVEAVAGFQVKRGFEETGRVDQKTWDRLVEMTREPTDDEMHNRIVAGPPILQPGDTGEKVRELQARLKQIGWFEREVTPNYGDVTSQAVAGFQVKRGLPETGKVDQETWDRLVAMTHEPSEDEMYNREPEEDEGDDGGSAAALDPNCQTGRVLCIDKSSRSLRWVIDGDVKLTLAVRFGSELTPTREGVFSVGWKSRDHVSSLYDTPMPYAMFFSGGQAVHYSPDFAQNGYNGASHGCVNVQDKDSIAWLFDEVNVGDKVVVYWS